MPLLSALRIQRVTHRVIATVVAVSLLSMPVTYRGGVDAAHAHTIFQLWEDVRLGSFTHHAPEDEPERRRAHDHPVTIDPHGAGARETVKDPLTGMGTVALELDEDAPVVSSAFTPSVRGTMLALTSAPSLLVPESFAARVRTRVRLDGITDSPTAPPPRRAA